jgi:hypothetical protein
MAWTTPVDQATGFLVTAAVYNAHIIDNLAYLHGDSGAAIDLTGGGQFLRPSAIQLGAADTVFSRLQASIASLLGTSAGDGNIYLGGTSASLAMPNTYTPGGRRLFNRVNCTTTPASTLTIAAPVDTPAANVTALIIICIHNSTGGALTLSWNAAYAGPSTAGPGNGVGLLQGFIFNATTGKWDLTFGNLLTVSD